MSLNKQSTLARSLILAGLIMPQAAFAAEAGASSGTCIAFAMQVLLHTRQEAR